MTHNEILLKEAIRLNKEGIKVCFTKDPTKPAGKAPIGKWRPFIDGEQTTDDIKRLFDYANKKDSALGLAAICDDTLEVIDIDTKYFLPHHSVFAVFDKIIDAVGIAVFQSLIEVKTISGGVHLIYRSEGSTRNQPLASRYTTDKERQKNPNSDKKTIVETRAKGGIFLISPSKGYMYDKESRSILDAPILSVEQRNALINGLKSLEETNEVLVKESVAKTPVELSNKSNTIDIYNDTVSCCDLLEQNGWQYKYTHGKNKHYVRPGKSLSEGIGAGVWTAENLVRIFTDNATLEAQKTYNAFQCYAAFYCDGDTKKAWRELYDKGFGDRMQSVKHTTTQKIPEISSNAVVSGEQKTDTEEKQNDDLLNDIFTNRGFDINNKPKEKPAVAFLWDYSKNDYTPIGGYGDIITISGLQKSRKSAAAAALVSCFLKDGIGEAMGFKAIFEGKNILHLDTEQSALEHYWTCRNMIRQQSLPLNENPTNFHSFRIKEYSIDQRLKSIEMLINRIGNVGVVFVDGIVDLCKDYNEQVGSRALVDYIYQLASKYKFLLVDILHNARSTGKLRGHIGTELGNKGRCNINIMKNKDAGTSTLIVDDLRGAPEPSDLEFYHNEQGLMELTEPIN